MNKLLLITLFMMSCQDDATTEPQDDLNCTDIIACNYGELENCLYSFSEATYNVYSNSASIISIDESWIITDIIFSSIDDAFIGILEVSNGTDINDSYNNIVQFVTLTFELNILNVMYGGNSEFGYTDASGGFSLPMDENTVLETNQCID